MPLCRHPPPQQGAIRGHEPRQQQRWDEPGSSDAACPQPPPPACSCLSCAPRWGGTGAVEALAVGPRTAGRSIVCHLLSGEVWPPLGDPAPA